MRYAVPQSSLFGRQQSQSQSLDNLNAMGAVGTLFSIIDLTSTAVAGLDWHLYRSAKSGKKEDRVEVMSHLALDVLNNPNAFTSREELFEAGQQHLDLTGEVWFVIQTTGAMGGVPLGLWPMRPDRVEVVPSSTHFIAGYVYTGPDGEKIPLTTDQVLRIRVPNPSDPYRALGPVQSIKTNADGMRHAVEWNMRFFANGAEPGGIIEFNTRVGDDQWKEFVQRWGEQHRGTSNAHRVATIEDAHWIDRKYTHTEMGFEKLYDLGDTAIKQAFRIHDHMLGQTEDVNLANANAAQSSFDRTLTVPRGNRWRGMLNRQFLPKFGQTGVGLEFDFDSPVTEDEATDAETFMNRARGVQWLVQSGYDGVDSASAAGLPDMKWNKDDVIRSATEIAAPTPDPAAGGGDTSMANRLALPSIRNADPAPDAPVDPTSIDLTAPQEAWAFALEQLLAHYTSQVLPHQRKELVDQIVTVIDSGDLSGLATITADTSTAKALIKVAMVGLADLSGNHVVQEAARQGIILTAAEADADTLGGWAGLSSELLAMGLQIAAAREAMRVYAPEMSGVQVADVVAPYLEALSNASVRTELGGVLTAAQNQGRFATIRKGPEASLYASEVNDSNTCIPCHQVNGRFLGTVSEMAQVERMYPSSGYVDCLGGPRCRGTVVAVWRPKTGGDE